MLILLYKIAIHGCGTTSMKTKMDLFVCLLHDKFHVIDFGGCIIRLSTWHRIPGAEPGFIRGGGGVRLLYMWTHIFSRVYIFANF